MSELLAGFWVPGQPIAQGSKRALVNQYTGKTTMVESAHGLNFWRRRVADSCLHARVLCAGSGPLKLVLRFRLPRPKSAPKRGNGFDLAAKRPDLSKLVRAVEDAVTGVLYRDDSQIVQIDAEKSVGREGEVPGVKVELWSVELPAQLGSL